MGLPCFRGKALALALLLQAINLARGCRDYACWGVNMCSDGEFGGVCAAPSDCPSTAIQMMDNGVIQIVGWRCRVTLEQIRLALPENPNAVTKQGTEYTLNNGIWLRHGSILEIHGTSRASSPDTTVTLLKIKVRRRERGGEKSCPNSMNSSADRIRPQYNPKGACPVCLSRSLMNSPCLTSHVACSPVTYCGMNHTTLHRSAVGWCKVVTASSYRNVHSSERRMFGDGAVFSNFGGLLCRVSTCSFDHQPAADNAAAVVSCCCKSLRFTICYVVMEDVYDTPARQVEQFFRTCPTKRAYFSQKTLKTFDASVMGYPFYGYMFVSCFVCIVCSTVSVRFVCVAGGAHDLVAFSGSRCSQQLCLTVCLNCRRALTRLLPLLIRSTRTSIQDHVFRHFPPFTPGCCLASDRSRSLSRSVLEGCDDKQKAPFDLRTPARNSRYLYSALPSVEAFMYIRTEYRPCIEPITHGKTGGVSNRPPTAQLLPCFSIHN